MNFSRPYRFMREATHGGARWADTRNCLRHLSQPHAWLFLLLLLSGDIVFLGLHIINEMTDGLPNPMLNLEHDNSYPEIYQYIKFFWIAFLLFYISFKNKTLHYIPLALVFSYFLFDDSLRIHERVGRYLATEFEFVPMFGLRPRDFGEIAVSAIVGVFLLLLLIWVYRTGSQIYRKIFREIAGLILLLVFFGVFVDILHIVVKFGGNVSIIFGLLEDWGEMVTVSLIAWYAFLLKVRGINRTSLIS